MPETDTHREDIFLRKLMNKANIGWWEADVKTECYKCSGFIAQLLGLDEDGIISFNDFNKRILREDQQHTTSHSFDELQQTIEEVYLLDTPKGGVWIRSKICYQETDEAGNTKIYGIAETQDGPHMASAYQALQNSERILHNIYKNIPVGIELYNKDGLLIDLNKKELEMFHIASKEDVLGVNLFENPLLPEEIKQKLRNNEDADFTFCYEFSKINGYYQSQNSGGSIDLTTKVTTLYDHNHEPINYLVINVDKTENTIAYNKIQEFKNFFDLVGDYAKVGYAHFDALSRDGYALSSWYRNVGEKEGTPLPEIIGIHSHFHPEDRAVMLDFLDKVIKGESSKLCRDMRIRRADGNYTWTRVNVLVRNYLPQDNIIEMLCINFDITQLKETERMLIQAKEKAEESDRLKSAFLANMSHEIRTPLNAIVGFSRIIAESTDAEERQDYYDIVEANNERLLQLINEILDLSKIEAGMVEFTITPVRLHPLCKEIHDALKFRCPEGVELVYEASDEEIVVEGDKNRIFQVISNLIGNAFKFTTSGSVGYGYRRKGNGIEFHVSDTGIGIETDKLARVFERFVKVNNFAQGTGLGLSICKTIIERLGGTISVSSEVGKGTTFTFTLPLAEGKREPAEEQNPLSEAGFNTPGNAETRNNTCGPDEETHEHQATQTAGTSRDTRKPTILIAEDTDSNYVLVKAILGKSYHLERAKDGMEAVTMFEELHPDLILMDMKMPNLSGLDATKIIRELSPGIPVIALTAYAYEHDRQAALDAGCNDFLTKPYTQEILKELINKYLKQTGVSSPG